MGWTSRLELRSVLEVGRADKVRPCTDNFAVYSVCRGRREASVYRPMAWALFHVGLYMDGADTSCILFVVA